MSLFAGVNPVAVLVATIAYYILGFLWYTKLFGETWREETGLPAPTAPPPPSALLGQFVSTFLFTFGVATIIDLRNIDGIAGGVLAAALVTVCFAIPINSGNLFFTGKTRLFMIDVAERAVGSVLVGVILGAWR